MNKVTIDQIYGLPYYDRKGIYTGSLNKICYRIEKINNESEWFNIDGENGEEVNALFLVTVWPGPYCYDKSDASLMERKTFTYDEESKAEVVDWINSKGINI